MKQEEYMKYVADTNFSTFYDLGHAVAGHNGPHGHLDTPVRNTAHYLIIYMYLYKKHSEEKYFDISKRFVEYLLSEQKKTKSGAIQCMEGDRFDHLNGLIGQAWVIEALLYYYEYTKDSECLDTAEKIYKSQKYDYDLHLWHRIELDGTDIGYDGTYNHQVWFAACVSKLSKYCNSTIDDEIKDFLTKGVERDFRTYANGILRHSVKNVDKRKKIKKIAKIIATPIKAINPRLLDSKYIEKAYHIFDMYGFAILQEAYPDMPLFKSKKYSKAVLAALDIDRYDKDNNVASALKKNTDFNVYGYSYNAPAFEYPFVNAIAGKHEIEKYNQIYMTQEELMFDPQTLMFSKHNPDTETWNARTYEIIRYLEFKDRK